MALPYENATSGDRAVRDIQKILQQLGCSKVGSWTDFETGDVVIQFEHHGRPVEVKVNAKGYAAAWLRDNPYNSRRRCTKAAHESKALEIGQTAIYSILRDWIKGQATAMEIGMLDFEGAFLSHLMLPTGRTLLEELRESEQFPMLEHKGNPDNGN